MRIRQLITRVLDWHCNPQNYIKSIHHEYDDRWSCRVLPLEESLGVKMLGEGQFGWVFALNERWAIKIGKKPDAAYEKFLDFCQEPQNRGNPHLPRIRTRFTVNLPETTRDYAKEITIAVIERLEQGTQEEKNFMVQRLESIASMERDRVRGELRDEHERAAAMTNRFIVPREDCLGPMLTQTIRSLEEYRFYQCSEEYSWDLHGGNFMLRGDTPVITDPWYDRNG